MSVETVKESLQLNKIIAQKKHTILVEEDCIVPDTKPDILNVLNTNGTVCIYKKEVLEGKIKIEGSINTYIMYLADTQEISTVRTLNTNVDFSEMIDMENVEKDMYLDANFSLKSINCNILNGRKINVKAEIEIQANVLSNEKVEYIKSIPNLNDIQLLNKKYRVNSLIGIGNTKIYAKDTVKINDEDNLIEIMKSDFKIINKSTKISYNKILVKSDLEVKLMYLTEDNRICMCKSKIPIMGFIDMENISEEHNCNVKYEIKNIIIKPNNIEEHSVYVEAEIEVECEAYENKEIEIIQDLYSPSMNLSYKTRKINTVREKEIVQQVCNISEKQIIPELKSKNICDVEVYPIIEKQDISNGKVNYKGELELNVIYSMEKTSQIETKNVIIPYNFDMNFDGVTSQTEVDTLIEVTSQNFVILPDESTDIKIDLTFTAINMENSEVCIIDEIEEKEIDKKDGKYSMVIYFAKKDDTLWKIAKKFKGTMEEISRINGIKECDLKAGKQLFIPRYNG